jgi:predicted amidohydrolase YtcJ
MLADLAVLDRDILVTPASELHSMRLAATIVGGGVVYEG